jgi:hypothetical protein
VATNGTLKRLYSRYYCSNVAPGLHRVYPYDRIDMTTEGPVIGKSGEAILLTSLNNSAQIRESGMKWAWCFSCDKWVQASRRTQQDLLLEYLRRPGVSMRLTARSEQARARELAGHMEKTNGKHRAVPDVKVIELRGVASRRRQAAAR